MNLNCRVASLLLALVVTIEAHKSPVGRIVLSKRMPGNLAYKGSVFSYSSNSNERNDPRSSLRDYILEADTVKALEESFVDHFSETILTKLVPQMSSGVPSMAIPSLDPLRLEEINVQPAIGDDRFHLKLNDIEIRGLSDLDIQDLRPKLNALKVRVALAFPKIVTACHFNVNGTLYNMINLGGEGRAELDFRDVTFRSQLHLAFENGTLRVANSDPPLVDFGTAKIRLFKIEMNKNIDANNATTSVPLKADAEIGMNSEVGPLLFWVLADHIVQEVDEYLLKYLNANMLMFKVPETFTPLVTWFMNRSGLSASGSSSSPSFVSLHHHSQHPMLGGSFGPGVGRFSPFPLINHFLSSMTNFRGPQISIETRNLLKRGVN